jgi:phage terminase large subunit-like protein
MTRAEAEWYSDPTRWCQWKFFARDEQIAPTGDWATWLYLAGRGSGKTRRRVGAAEGT